MQYQLIYLLIWTNVVMSNVAWALIKILPVRPKLFYTTRKGEARNVVWRLKWKILQTKYLIKLLRYGQNYVLYNKITWHCTWFCSALPRQKISFSKQTKFNIKIFKAIADIWPFTGFLQNRRKKLFVGAVPVIWLHDNIPSSSSCLLWWDNYPWYAANDK